MFDIPPPVIDLSHAQELVQFVEITNTESMMIPLKSSQNIDFSHDVEAYAQKVRELLGDGFQWGDIPKAVTYTLDLCEAIYGGSTKELAIAIIDAVITITDTPVLPDRVTDPIFKIFAHSLINLSCDYMEGKTISYQPILWEEQTSVQAPSKEKLDRFVYRLEDIFEDGFQWDDVAKMIALSSNFMDQYILVGEKEKKAYMVQIIDDVIDITDTPYLPDSVFDPVFKLLVPSFVDFIVELKK